MSKDYFCWRCKKIVPMLEENEWQELLPLFGAGEPVPYLIAILGDDRISKSQYSVRKNRPAVEKHHELTGVWLAHDEIIHHRLADWGEECPVCKNLLRTPRARFCVCCGYKTQRENVND